MEDRFDSAFRKIERARKHIDDLEVEVNTFWSSGPCCINEVEPQISGRKAMNEHEIGWILTLKDNQPGLHALADVHPWQDEPVLHAASETGHGRHEVRTIRVTSQVPAQITERLPRAAQLMLIERYRHPVRDRAAAAACRAAAADADGDDLGLSACAADHGAKISWENRPGRHRPDPRPGRPRLPAGPRPRPLRHRERAALPPRHHAGRRRLPAASRRMLAAVRLHRQHHRQRAQPGRAPQPRRRPP